MKILRKATLFPKASKEITEKKTRVVPQGTVVVNLDCGHWTVFTIESIMRNGLPSRWYCLRCRRTMDIVTKKVVV